MNAALFIVVLVVTTLTFTSRGFTVNGRFGVRAGFRTVHSSAFRCLAKKGGGKKKGKEPAISRAQVVDPILTQSVAVPVPVPEPVVRPPQLQPQLLQTRPQPQPQAQEELIIKGMPDKAAFITFYNSRVTAGNEMSQDDMMAYPAVAELLAKRLVDKDDIDGLWVSAVGDAKGLNAQEGYDMLCMITDLPEPEDAEWLDSEFKKLVGAKGGAVLPFFKFLNWEDVQDMMGEGVLSMEDISQLWRDVAGDLNASIDRAAFGLLNTKLDDAIDAKESASSDKDEIDLTGIDVWSPDFDPTEVFDPEMLEQITNFFVKASPRGQLTLERFLEWDELVEMYAEGLTPAALRGLWDKALVASGRGGDSIRLDTFIRLNVALDLLLDEIEEQQPKQKTTTTSQPQETKGQDNDAESFYRQEFRKATGSGRLMRLDMLLEWPEIQDLVTDGVVTEKQVEKMWNGLPQEPMGLPATSSGINEETFVAFNAMLDAMLEVTESSGSASASAGGATKKTTSTPQLLVSEPARPMPKMAEMKMGSLGPGPGPGGNEGEFNLNKLGSRTTEEGDNSESNTGLSESELELMQVLDKADNMLNSGSFGDFDQLIGDMNDPRLQALREKRDGAEEVRGQLNDVIQELLKLSRQQSRCGLDRPDEETAARIRDLIQAVIEKSPRAASSELGNIRKALNGKWKLLYTNSEMFSFYNGVTGFANVFPASKFSDLSMQYASDGYLAESKYFERLTTPLGTVDATVFSTWELVKEMSFMTNENSVVLRNYCTKVTAGPMEYLAEENWKSLRTMSMNELVYVDDRVKIMRNSGALRIFFVYEKERE